MNYVPKINTKRDMCCLELRYVTAEGGSRLRATLSEAENITGDRGKHSRKIY